MLSLIADLLREVGKMIFFTVCMCVCVHVLQNHLPKDVLSKYSIQNVFKLILVYSYCYYFIYS
jgi:hypothetical protein